MCYLLLSSGLYLEVAENEFYHDVLVTTGIAVYSVLIKCLGNLVSSDFTLDTRKERNELDSHTCHHFCFDRFVAIA